MEKAKKDGADKVYKEIIDKNGIHDKKGNRIYTHSGDYPKRQRHACG